MAEDKHVKDEGIAPSPKKSKLFNRFKTNKKLEEEGVELEYGDGIAVTVRSTNSIAVREYQAKLFKKNRNVMTSNGGLLPPEIADAIDDDVCATKVVLGWRGVTNEDGASIAFSRAAALALFKELPSFRKDIMYLAGLDETFKDQGLEAQAGN